MKSLQCISPPKKGKLYQIEKSCFPQNGWHLGVWDTRITRSLLYCYFNYMFFSVILYSYCLHILVSTFRRLAVSYHTDIGVNPDHHENSGLLQHNRGRKEYVLCTGDPLMFSVASCNCKCSPNILGLLRVWESLYSRYRDVAPTAPFRKDILPNFRKCSQPSEFAWIA